MADEPERRRQERGRMSSNGFLLEEMWHLVDLGYTSSQIAEYFGVSKKTVERYRKAHGIRKKDVQANVTDAQLDEMVRRIMEHNRMWGEKMVSGLLKSRGIVLPRNRVRESLRRVDPQGVQMRWRNVLHRRVYSVAGPNALWHTDGNHKLIRWRMVVHGGIDGFSRIPVFLQCSNDNSAQTVLDAFTGAVSRFGLPQRVRSDKGMENVLVCDYMLQHPLRGVSTFIAGRSVHNQRIERLWRDVYQGCELMFLPEAYTPLFIPEAYRHLVHVMKGCLRSFYLCFSSLEENDMLDVTSDIDLFALHHVYIPIVNHALKDFKEGYMHHKLRTEHNQSPIQLWVRGVYAGTPVDDVDEADLHLYGVEGDHGAAENQDNNHVIVPAGIRPSGDQLNQLNYHFPVDINKLQGREEQISYFSAVKEFLLEMLD